MTGRGRQNEKRRVLVMDDDRLVRAAFVRGLNRHYEIVEASSGDEALSMLRISVAEKRPFEVIVADMTLPGMDGVSFFDEVCTRFPDSCDRVLFVTGGSTNPRTELFLRKTRNEVLMKPILHDRLREAIEGVAERCSAKRAADKTTDPPR